MTKTVAQRGGILDNLATRYAAAVAYKQEHGVLIKHFRPQQVDRAHNFGIRCNHGGLTVAFHHKRGNSFIEISTANCSFKDMYNRKAGTVLAVESFANGQRIRLQLLPGETPMDIVEHLGSRYTVDLACTCCS